MPAAPEQLLYQPRYDCRSGALVGAKLYIARAIRPDSMILDAASGASLARMKEVCAEAARWNPAGAGQIVLSMGARIEALCDPDFAQNLNRVLLDSGLRPCCIELNIVTAQGEVSDESAAALFHLKTFGVRFGISAASPANGRIAWLRRLPLDTMEVPAGLVEDVISDPEGVAIVRALITRAHRQGLTVRATGIRRTHPAAVMVANACDQLDGPLLGHPLSTDAFEALLAGTPRLDPELIHGPRPERTLLLVDDESNILSSLRRLLRRDGYTILTAGGGREGLEVLATTQVDVIISDQRMPGMTGVEFLRKAKDMFPDTVRMVLSGYTDLQSVTDAINEGAIYKFLTKPWDDAMLRANIEEAFLRKVLSDDNRRLGEALQEANAELERINARLTGVLAEQKRCLALDAVALTVTQEALAMLPVPVLGIDPEGMIAFANAAADRLFPAHAPLFGFDCRKALPAAVCALLQRGSGKADFGLDGARLRVEASPLGTPARGTLLSFVRLGEQP